MLFLAMGATGAMAPKLVALWHPAPNRPTASIKNSAAQWLKKNIK
jgi:hypothetical protein